MSYQVLARKWRPRTFHELVGQEHVQRALVNALDQGRLHHAYLFTGTRGVGKTTLARILAKCLNCIAAGQGDEGVTSSPCGECASCVAIDEGRFVDLIEVDAASRTKVEDTRELLDNVQYAPTQGRYKVYLIDEVHMLSTSSFNALLKTLEEPPPHVKFLLATTDPQKLPATVLSRCLQFTLKHMPPERIVEHLAKVLGAESVPFEESALWLLGRAAEGSMRDAMSLTDQAIAFGQGRVEHADVAAMLGTLDQRQVLSLVEALAEVDAARVLAEVEGKPLQELLLRVMNYSNNFMADMLALNLVETPRADLHLGGAAIEAFAAGLPDHGPVTLLSGSGLTTENRTSARGANALLESMYFRPSLFPSFVATLQSPGNGVMRFIRRGSPTFQHHVMLKTGTLNQPVAVRAVSGYFRTRSGRWGVFSALVNGTGSTPYLSWSEVLDPLSVDLERMIDSH